MNFWRVKVQLNILKKKKSDNRMPSVVKQQSDLIILILLFIYWLSRLRFTTSWMITEKMNLPWHDQQLSINIYKNVAVSINNLWLTAFVLIYINSIVVLIALKCLSTTTGFYFDRKQQHTVNIPDLILIFVVFLIKCISCTNNLDCSTSSTYIVNSSVSDHISKPF